MERSVSKLENSVKYKSGSYTWKYEKVVWDVFKTILILPAWSDYMWINDLY